MPRDRPAVLVANSKRGRLALEVALAHPAPLPALFPIAPTLSGAPTNARGQAAKGAQCAMPLDILLVDDQSDFLNMLTEVLELDGHRVHAARYGHDALTLMIDRLPTVVIVGGDLQDFTGTNLVAHLRAVAEVRRLEQPLVAIAIRGELVCPGDAAAEGFDYVLSKSLVDELVSVVAKL